MSDAPRASSEHEHGTMQSYVVGFVLSLALTLIPYYLVVNHKLTGLGLLLAILAFAVLQMLIQITFFLHLGRGPKPKWNLFFFISTVGIILVVIGGSIIIINNLHYNMQPPDQVALLINNEGIPQVNGIKTGACYGQHPDHQVTIENGKATPSFTQAARCDTLTFTNEDNVARDIAFGQNTNFQPYAGVADLSLRSGQSQRLTLSQSGSFIFRDNLHNEVTGRFSVAP